MHNSDWQWPRIDDESAGRLELARRLQRIEQEARADRLLGLAAMLVGVAGVAFGVWKPHASMPEYAAGIVVAMFGYTLYLTGSE